MLGWESVGYCRIPGDEPAGQLYTFWGGCVYLFWFLRSLSLYQSWRSNFRQESNPKLARLPRRLPYSAIPENREFKKWKFVLFFFCQRHALSTSFDIFVVTYRMTNFLLKLVTMLLFSMEKNWISTSGFPLFSGYAPYPLAQPCSQSLFSWKFAGKIPFVETTKGVQPDTLVVWESAELWGKEIRSNGIDITDKKPWVRVYNTPPLITTQLGTHSRGSSICSGLIHTGSNALREAKKGSQAFWRRRCVAHAMWTRPVLMGHQRFRASSSFVQTSQTSVFRPNAAVSSDSVNGWGRALVLQVLQFLRNLWERQKFMSKERVCAVLHFRLNSFLPEISVSKLAWCSPELRIEVESVDRKVCSRKSLFDSNGDWTPRLNPLLSTTPLPDSCGINWHPNCGPLFSPLLRIQWLNIREKGVWRAPTPWISHWVSVYNASLPDSCGIETQTLVKTRQENTSDFSTYLSRSLKKFFTSNWMDCLQLLHAFHRSRGASANSFFLS